MAKPIVAQLTKASGGYPKGTELGYASEAVARKHLGDDFKIVRYTDTSEYVAPERTTDGPTTETVSESKAKKG